MTAGASADAWAAEAGRLRWWQHIAAVVGVETPGMARGRRLSARRRAGSIGEQRTHAMLQPLLDEGWQVLADRALPGTRANLDHLLVAPDAQLFILDSKLWSGRYRVRLVGGRLVHGERDYDGQVDTVLGETRRASQALEVTVTPLVVVHNAPVDGGGFHVRGVAVFPADRMLELLRRNTGRPDPVRARRLAELAAARLPSYVQ